MDKLVIITAQEREIMPLVTDAALGFRAGQSIRAAYRSFENDRAVIVCAGLGGRAATDAAERSITRFSPSMLLSAGMAGALNPGLHVGHVLRPHTVISGGQEFESALPGAARVLVSAGEIASTEAKRLLARQYSADAVDMDSAAVAIVARRHGIPFGAVKAIADESDFEIPDLAPFISAEGKLLVRELAFHAAVRPKLWRKLRELRTNVIRASVELCRELETLISSHAAIHAR